MAEGEGVLTEMSEEERQGVIVEFISEAKDQHLQALNQILLRAEETVKSEREMSDSDLNAMFRSAHTIKGSASFIGFKKIVGLTHEMETLLQKVKTRELPLTSDIIQVLFEAFDMLETLFKGLEEKGAETGDIEGVVKDLNALLQPGAAYAPSEKAKLSEPAAAQPLKAAVEKVLVDPSIRIDARKLDNLMNLSSELVVLRSRFDQFLNNYTDSSPGKRPMLAELTGSLGRLTGDLHLGVMQARMVPVGTVFNKFRRVVRDLCKDLGKDVNLLLAGENTELDKKIVDALGDPMTHLIRNAIDHGVEGPKDRIAAGKPAVGTVLLRASQHGNMVWIEIKDDGKGIDARRVSDIALGKGLITREQLAAMTDKEKLDFIFLPGFSTAKSVTKISGRGVGMDVVKSMITAFNGLIEIDTVLGKGTSFILKIPLSLATVVVLLANVGGGIYAFPVDAVVELIHIVPGQVHTLGLTGVIRLRDEVIRILDMERVMGLKARKVDKHSSADVMIISDGSQKMGVVVDRVVGQAEVVLKPVPSQCSSSFGVAGTAILGDGTVTVILDPVTILKFINTPAAAEAISGVSK